jgi:serine/threonine-protein kinase
MKILEAGETIGRFVIEGVLGEGALAVVYRVRHKNLGTQHALKVLKVPHDIVVERLMNEGRAQATLQHENVVSVTDIVDIDGAPGLLMEYVEGTTLKDVLRHGRLSLRQAASVGRGLLAGVSAAHRAGLIHRDLKPANILMQIRGKRMVPKITDFGLVKALGGDPGGSLETRTGIVLGTPHYMAPEQFDDARNVDQRADVFSVGVILYELVTGQRPYTGSGLLDIMNAAMKGDYPPLEELCPDLPDGMQLAIESALQAERDERVGNCEVLFRMWTTDGPGSGADVSSAEFQTEVIAKIREDAEASLERSIERLGRPPASPRPLRPLPTEPPTEHDGRRPVFTDAPTDAHTEVTETTTGRAGMAPLPSGPPSLDTQLPTEEMDRVVAATRGPAPPEPPPSDEPRWMLPVLALLLLLALGIGGVAVVGAGAVALFGGSLTTTQPVPATPLPDPVPVPEPVQAPAPEPIPEPVEEPAPVAEPVEAPDPTPVSAPTPRPDPVPVPNPVPGPLPVPVDTPIPEPPSGTGTVDVAGDHTSIVLVADDGRRVQPGEVDPGDYDIFAAFPDAPVDKRGRIRVKAGEKIQLLCDGQVRYDCRVLENR